MRGYRGSDMISNGGSNGYHPHQYRGSVASNSVDLGGQSRRYPRSDFPPTRYRPPLPTYTMQSVSRSSSYGSSANHNKSSTNEVPRSSSVTRPPYRRSMSLSPSRVDDFKYRETLAPVRTLIRESFRDDPSGGRGLNGHNGHGPDAHSSPSSLRIGRRSPSVAKERTRDELIDSIVHTRTREHRVMPGFHNASDWEERKAMGIDCDKIYPGIILGNGETIQNVEYLKKIGVTHVLNTAERHVSVNPAKYPLHGISYFGFHVDDHPMANIARFFGRTTDFIDEALCRNGLIVVNCVMGWSRSATVVAAYLMMKQGMSSAEALQTIRQSRPIRPNPGFLQQLADHENLLNKKPFW